MRFRVSRCSAFVPLTLVYGLACGSAAPSTTVSTSSDGVADDGAPYGDAFDGTSGDALTADGPSAGCQPDTRASASQIPDGEVPVAGSCGSAVAARTFSSALCSCEDTNVAGFLRTRSFRSQSGGAAELLGGNVGVNRNYLTGGFADVGGSFVVAGSRDVIFGGFLQTGGDLRFNPDFDVAGFVDVGNDAWLGGELRAVGSIDVTGDLHRAQGSGFFGLALLRVGGSQQTGDVVVPSPCGCEPDQLLDVAGLVAEARTRNDNAAIGLDPHALDLVVGLGNIITLPTGRFYVHQIAGAGALGIRATGKVALFVDDDFVAGGLFRVSVDPGAELDIFVKDNMVLAGAAVLGDPARPSATRFYVGGTGDIAVAGINAFAGNLYAPTANILVGGIGRVFGSLFGKNIISAGFLDVGYDQSIREGGEGCPPPVTGPSDPPGDDPGGDDPGGDTPAGGGPPGGDTPAGGTPSGGDTPAGGAPPGGGTPAGGTPSEPGDQTPGADTPADAPPGGDAPTCPEGQVPIVR